MRKLDISTPKYQDTFTLVDDEDFEYLDQWKWRCKSSMDGRVFGVVRSKNSNLNGKKRCQTILLHREIMPVKKEMVIDHINHNVLDNRKENLRICSRLENNMNVRSRGGASVYKGVCYNSRISRVWFAQIKFKGKLTHLGSFYKEKNAARAYNKKAKELFGEFAFINEIKEIDNEN